MHAPKPCTFLLGFIEPHHDTLSNSSRCQTKACFREIVRSSAQDIPIDILSIMDPATIVGTTSAILGFVQFTGKLISVACEIYESSDGAVDDNQKLEEAVTDLQIRLRGLRPTEESSRSADAQAGVHAARTDAEKSVLQTAIQCQTLGNEILEILNKTKAKVVQIDETRSQSLLRRSWRRLRRDDSGGTAPTCKPTVTEAIKASVQTVWQKDKVGLLRQRWEFCVGRLNADLQR